MDERTEPIWQTMAAVRLGIVAMESDLRATEADLARLTAECQQSAIDLAGGLKALGSNEAEQKRVLALAVMRDDDCQNTATVLRDLQARKERLAATLENLHSEERADRLATLAHLADQLAAAFGPGALHSTQQIAEVAAERAIEQAEQIAARALVEPQESYDPALLPF